MQKLLLMTTCCVLAACGSGGDSDNNATNTSTSAPATTVTSTALKDNTVPEKTTFTQFYSYQLQLPDKTALFKSKNIYLKLYTNDGKTLFLGRYLPAIPLNLHLPNHVKSLKADIFSTDPADPQLTEEIIL